MSVLIKGMKKPKSCATCPVERDGFPDEWEMHCLFLDRQVGYFGKKLKVPKDCPIVEVPTSAQPEQQWIPCSERLPEDSGDYLVRPSDSVLKDYSDFNKVEIMPYDADCEAFGWWEDRYDPISLGFVDSDFYEFEVLAWMPLPEPYEEPTMEEFMQGQDPGDPEDGSL